MKELFWADDRKPLNQVFSKLLIFVAQTPFQFENNIIF